MTSVQRLTCTWPRCQSSICLSRKVCFISLQSIIFFQISQISHILFFFTSCWFVSKMLNLAGVIVNHLLVCVNLVCPTSLDGGECSLRDERSRRRSFPVGSERKCSIWLSLPHFISVTQHSSSSSKWPYYPQEAGCSQYIRGKRQPCGCLSLSLFVLRVRAFLFGWPEQDVDDGKLMLTHSG